MPETHVRRETQGGTWESERSPESDVKMLDVYSRFFFFFFFLACDIGGKTHKSDMHHLYIKKKTYKSRFYAISSLHNMITTTLWPRLITTFSLLLRSFGSKLRDRQPAPAALGQFVISTNKTHYNIVILYKSSATMTS